MKKCGLKTTPMTSRCFYQSGEDTCLFSGSCRYLQDPQNCDSPVQKPSIEFKPSLEERSKQECSTCSHREVCKFKDKFESMKKEHFPLLCVCQWYKKENDICTELEYVLHLTNSMKKSIRQSNRDIGI